MKQTTITEKIVDRSSTESGENRSEKSSESPVTNEQQIAPTDSIDNTENKDDEQEPQKNLHIELKPPSACKMI